MQVSLWSCFGGTCWVVGITAGEWGENTRAISSLAHNVLSPVACIQGRKPTKRTAVTLRQMIHAWARTRNCRRARVNRAARATGRGHHRTELRQHGRQTAALMTPGVGQTSSAWMRKMASSLSIILRDKPKCIPTLRLTIRTPAMLKHGTTASLNQVKDIGHASPCQINVLSALTHKAVCLCIFEQDWLINSKMVSEEKNLCAKVACSRFPSEAVIGLPSLVAKPLACHKHHNPLEWDGGNNRKGKSKGTPESR